MSDNVTSIEPQSVAADQDDLRPAFSFIANAWNVGGKDSAA